MLSEKVLQTIRAESIVKYGVHSIVEWENGGSDAVDLPIHTKLDFRKEFPNVNTGDLTDFFDGKRDGFVVDRIADDARDGEMMTYKVYYCVQETDDSITILDNDGDIVIERFTEVKIDTMIENWLDASELEKLLQGLSDILSGLGIGEADAWKLVCHIEEKAIAALNAKRAEPTETPEPAPDIPNSDLVTAL